jgi:hypothetical protein
VNQFLLLFKKYINSIEISIVYIVVNILDVNDNDPVFDVLDKEFFVVEGNATVVGTVFGSVRATDVDANNLVTYSLRF